MSVGAVFAEIVEERTARMQPWTPDGRRVSPVAASNGLPNLAMRRAKLRMARLCGTEREFRPAQDRPGNRRSPSVGHFTAGFDFVADVLEAGTAGATVEREEIEGFAGFVNGGGVGFEGGRFAKVV